MSPANAIRAWSWTGRAFNRCRSLPLADRGFRYGMALFESLRLHQGEALFLEEHVRRLRQACHKRGFPCPEPAWEALPGVFGKMKRETFVRIYVTAGEGAAADPIAGGRLLLLAEERARPSGEPLRLAIHEEPHRPLFGGIKTANYWANLVALEQARQAECEDALLFNSRQELISSCVANVFVVRDGTVKTPAVACGAREGVVRAWVQGLVEVREARLTLADILGADEVFLTNSWLGIQPVAAVENHQMREMDFGTSLRNWYETSVGA